MSYCYCFRPVSPQYSFIVCWCIWLAVSFLNAAQSPSRIGFARKRMRRVQMSHQKFLAIFIEYTNSMRFGNSKLCNFFNSIQMSQIKFLCYFFKILKIPEYSNTVSKYRGMYCKYLYWCPLAERLQLSQRFNEKCQPQRFQHTSWFTFYGYGGGCVRIDEVRRCPRRTTQGRNAMRPIQEEVIKVPLGTVADDVGEPPFLELFKLE